MKTNIIVDSTCDILPEEYARVTVVPLTVRFGQEEFIDTVTINKETFYQKLEQAEEIPTTSQATPYAVIGSIIGTHGGPGAIGIAFFKQ